MIVHRDIKGKSCQIMGLRFNEQKHAHSSSGRREGASWMTDELSEGSPEQVQLLVLTRDQLTRWRLRPSARRSRLFQSLNAVDPSDTGGPEKRK